MPDATFSSSFRRRRKIDAAIAPLFVWLFALRVRFSALLLKQRQILPVTFFFQFIYRNKTQRGGIDAEALPRRDRSVVENVA